MKKTFLQTRENLSIRAWSEADRRCSHGYKYTVQSGSSPLTAFRSRDSVVLWLRERNLTCDIPQEGEFSKIKGSFQTNLVMWSKEEWDACKYIDTGIGLSNGDYTDIKFTLENWIIVENIVNPNCKWREIYDYKMSNLLVG